MLSDVLFCIFSFFFFKSEDMNDLKLKLTNDIIYNQRIIRINSIVKMTGKKESKSDKMRSVNPAITVPNSLDLPLTRV